MTQFDLDSKLLPHENPPPYTNKMQPDESNNQQTQSQLHPQPPTPALPSKPNPSWQQTVERVLSTVTIPLNSIAVRKGTNTFTPQPVDKEFTKAASILSAFTTPDPSTSSKQPAQELIAASTLSSSSALLVLTTLRIGLRHVTLSSGSGVLLVRRPTPSSSSDPTPPTSHTPEWAPPVAVRALSCGAGPFALGIEVTDRVYAVQSKEALDMLLKGRWMGCAEGGVALGRRGWGGGVSFPGASSWLGGKKTEIHEVRRCECGREVEGGELMGNGEAGKEGGVRASLSQPIQCYVRAAGLYCGVQAEGMVIEEREEENRAFYGKNVSVVKGVIPTAEEEQGLSATCVEAMGALRTVLAGAETGREKRE